MGEKLLKIFCSNVRGLVCNWSNARSFNWSEFDVIALNEVWGIKDFENLEVDDFEIKAINLRKNSRGGGTLIFGKTNLETLKLETPFIEGIIETTGIKIGDVNFIQVYRPPSGSKDEFTDNLMFFLDRLGGQKIVIGGDFNLNTLVNNKWIDTLCHNYNLKIRITNPTRLESETCIDNFLTNVNGTFMVSSISIADHQAILAHLSVTNIKLKNKLKFYYREMKEHNWLLFKNELHKISIEGENIEQKWYKFMQDIKLTVETCFPIRSTTKKYLFSMSRGLLKCRDKKNSLLRKYKAGKLNKAVYVAYNNCYRKLIKTEQLKSFKNKLGQAGTNGKAKWKVIKEGLLLQKANENITEINNNGIITDNDEEIATAFKKHFETCAGRLADNLPKGIDTSIIMPQGGEWGFVGTSEQEISKIIKSLQNKNSSGEDLLSNRMLKMEPYIFARLIKPLINESIEKGIFPNKLKVANVIPIFKKGDKTNLNNYRPISLLPVLSKVFEKVINLQLTKIIDAGYIDDNQFGFRKNHSTEDAILKFVDRIEKDLAMKKHVATVYIDVSKAFDSCDHSIIVTKLKRTGLNDMGLNLMKSYLKDRLNKVKVNNTAGGEFTINLGVPQGSVLGPTLFKIYIMDLHLHTKLFCMKFADDSSFEGAGNTKYDLERLMEVEIDNISNWFKDNRLTLHPDKSRCMIHSKDKLVTIKIGNKNIVRCGYGLQEESVNLLGLQIDENIDWKVHVSKVEKKIAKGNYLLWRHGKKMNTEMQKLIYESFIRCHLLYCLTVWGGAKNSVLKPLIKQLQKSWKKIGRRKMHTLSRLQSYKILRLEDELEVQESKFLWKWDNNNLPLSLKDIIKEKQDNLRGRRFVIPSNTKAGSVCQRLTKRANKSISDITSAPSKKTLVKTLGNKIFTNKYRFNCVTRNCFICS